MAEPNEIAKALGIDTDKNIRIDDQGRIHEDGLIPRQTEYVIDKDGVVYKETVFGREETGSKLDRESGEIYHKEGWNRWEETGRRIDPRTGELQASDILGHHNVGASHRFDHRTGETLEKGIISDHNRFYPQAPPRVQDDQPAGGHGGSGGYSGYSGYSGHSDYGGSSSAELGWVGLAIMLAVGCLLAIYLIAAAILYVPMMVVGLTAFWILTNRALSQVQSGNPHEMEHVVQTHKVRLISCGFAATLGLLWTGLSFLFAPSQSVITDVAMIGPAVGLGIYFTWVLSGKILKKRIAKVAATGVGTLKPVNWQIVKRISGWATAATLAMNVLGVYLATKRPVASSPPYQATVSTPNNSSSITTPTEPVDEEANIAEPETDDLVAITDLPGVTVSVPRDWVVDSETAGSRSTRIYRFREGVDVRIDRMQATSSDPMATPRDLEGKFQASSLRRYRRLDLSNTGDSSRWEFLLTRKDQGTWLAEEHKLGRYFVVEGISIAILARAPESEWNTFKPLIERVIASIQVKAEATTTSAPQTTGALTESDLQGKSAWDLTVMRNEPYARHGLKFRREDLLRHFKKESWYSPNSSDANQVHDRLTETEKRNVAFIRDYQERKNLKG